MSGGLVALLDDVATLAKLAAASIDDVGAAAGKASAKAAGVVVDDTAVTPNYVRGFLPERELPIIKKIAIGSLRNKLVLILPVAILLSTFLPWVMPYLMIAGGSYLTYEGAEKLWEKFGGGHHEDDGEPEDAIGTPEHEKKMISGAIRTDLILSAEIMVIALASVDHQSFVNKLIILIIVAFAITALVYGVVAIIVKMDDVGLHLAGKQSRASQKIGRGLVLAMPKVMSILGAVGTAAMLWVGGHIFIVYIGEAGLHGLADVVQHAAEAVAHAVPDALSGFLGWTVETLISAFVGLILGGLILLVMHLIPRRKKAAAH